MSSGPRAGGGRAGSEREGADIACGGPGQPGEPSNTDLGLTWGGWTARALGKQTRAGRQPPETRQWGGHVRLPALRLTPGLDLIQRGEQFTPLRALTNAGQTHLVYLEGRRDGRTIRRS